MGRSKGESPVIVQGTAVVQGTPVARPAPRNNGDVPYGGATQVSQNNSNDQQEGSKTGCKDPFFAILFYVNIIGVFATVFALSGSSGDGVIAAADYGGYVLAAFVFGLMGFLSSGVGLFMLLTCPEFMIKSGLIFSLVMLVIWTFVSFAAMSFLLGVMGIVFILLTLCYIRGVWPRIPFAATNMVTAATAIKSNLGVTIFAVFFTLLQLGWFMLWTIAFYETYTKQQCDANNVCTPNYGLLFLLFLSLFFTQQVLESCVHVLVAGVVGTWWIAPDESGFCSKGVCNSFIRTITTSFGSICFGSLLVAILQSLKALASSARQNNDAAFLACIAECILGCLQSCLEYFNKWAYIYVGVYGFGYIEAGKSVMQLFADRGWDAVIADDLVGAAIMLVCVIIGLIVGTIGVIYFATSPTFKDLQDNLLSGFLIGFLAGIAISSILLSTVASGVNTVIVMFADAPREFSVNHPELSAKMVAKWQEFFPGSVQ